MKSTASLVCINFLFLSILSAQVQDKDSIDVIVLNGMAWKLRDKYLDTAFFYSNQALELSEKLNYTTGVANSNFNLGTFYYLMENYDTAKDYIFKALNNYKETSDKNKTASCYSTLGLIFSEQNNPSKAMQYQTKALKLIAKTGDKKSIARIYVNIGNLYLKKSLYYTAIFNYHKALELNVISGEKAEIAAIYNNIGAVYERKFENAKALEYYFKSLNKNREIQNKDGEAYSLANIGVVSRLTGTYQNAIEYLLKALAVGEEYKNEKRMLKCFNNLASAHESLGDSLRADKNTDLSRQHYSTAAKYYYKAQLIYKKTGKRNIILANNYFQCGVLYDKLNYPSAEERYKEAFDVFEELSHSPDKATARAGIRGMAVINIRISNLYFKKNKLHEAVTIINKAKELSGMKGQDVDLKKTIEKMIALYNLHKTVTNAASVEPDTCTLSRNIKVHKVRLKRKSKFLFGTVKGNNKYLNFYSFPKIHPEEWHNKINDIYKVGKKIFIYSINRRFDDEYNFFEAILDHIEYFNAGDEKHVTIYANPVHDNDTLFSLKSGRVSVLFLPGFPVPKQTLKWIHFNSGFYNLIDNREYKDILYRYENMILKQTGENLSELNIDIVGTEKWGAFFFIQKVIFPDDGKDAKGIVKVWLFRELGFEFCLLTTYQSDKMIVGFIDIDDDKIPEYIESSAIWELMAGRQTMISGFKNEDYVLDNVNITDEENPILKKFDRKLHRIIRNKNKPFNIIPQAK